MKQFFWCLVLITALSSFLTPTSLLNAFGKINMLRINDVGTKYGPNSDQIDVEVVITLNTEPGKAFGFQLRNDNNGPARTGMLDLLRDAYANSWNVNIDYDISEGKKNGTIMRVWLTK
jgi:hypothetical protein